MCTLAYGNANDQRGYIQLCLYSFRVTRKFLRFIRFFPYQKRRKTAVCQARLQTPQCLYDKWSQCEWDSQPLAHIYIYMCVCMYVCMYVSQLQAASQVNHSMMICYAQSMDLRIHGLSRARQKSIVCATKYGFVAHSMDCSLGILHKVCIKQTRFCFILKSRLIL